MLLVSRDDAELMAPDEMSPPGQRFLWCNVVQDRDSRTESVQQSWSGVGLDGIEPSASALSGLLTAAR